MERKMKLAPSILNADFSNLESAVKAVEPYSDYLHLDVMDGHFVPNITFGPMMVSTISEITTVPLECHLMIYNPPEWIETFANAGADRIAFHLRACRDAESVIRAIRSLDVSPGLAISPEVPIFELSPFLGIVDFIIVMCVYPGFGGQKLIPEMLGRVSAIKKDAAKNGIDIEVEVDGGVKTENLSEILRVGTDTIVVGSSIFKSENVDAAASNIKAIINGTVKDSLRTAGENAIPRIKNSHRS